MPKSPFGKGWAYVTVVMSGYPVTTQKQLWRNTKTGELKWHTL
jgi:hypothetical protein